MIWSKFPRLLHRERQPLPATRGGTAADALKREGSRIAVIGAVRSNMKTTPQ
jgi:hypothetical protein